MDRLMTLAQSASASQGPWNDHHLPEEVLVIIAMGIAGLLAMLVFVVVIPVAMHTKNEKEREQTKREIAAYAAEGSITPEEATTMIKAAVKPAFDCFGRRT